MTNAFRIATKILARLKEPSTYAGLAASFGALSIGGIGGADWDKILLAAMAVAGILSIVMKEVGSED